MFEEEEERIEFVQKSYKIEDNTQETETLVKPEPEEQVAEDTKEVNFDVFNEDNVDDVD